MLLLRVIVTLVVCWIVKCDLLDLYVQHMDETMRTMLYRNERHLMDPVTKRIKRSLVEDESQLRIDNFQKKQRLSVDENWLRQWKAKRKISYKNDALDYPNKQEENLNSDQHEIFSTQNSKYFEKMSTVFEDAAEESQLNVSQEPIIEEQEETSKDELTTMENQINIEELTSLESEEGRPKENWNSEEMESEDISQFEIISENERINPKLFVGPSFKRKPWGSQIPKKYFPEKPAKDVRGVKCYVKDETAIRSRRSANQKVNEGIPNIKVWNFTRYEKLDENSDMILEWDPSDEEEVIFRITGRTLGYVGIGFNEKTNMIGADILLAWVDDHTGIVNLLDSHGSEETNTVPVLDTYQDVRVLSGLQNETHTTVTFARKWQTCDPEDYQLTSDTVRVLWALHETDPELNSAMWHRDRRGGRALRLKTAATHSPPQETHNIRHWDVKLNQFDVHNTDTVYWCKMFNANSVLPMKHHIIGYTPLVEKANEDLVHHMILYECASTETILAKHARMTGTHCYSKTMPEVWNSCLRPVVAWARGSRGEWMPEHVGIPIADNKTLYYMLEVHYNNPSMKKVTDSSGIRLYLTPKLRPQEAGILVTGVAINPLHFVPPHQKEYATVGYCTPHCTNMMFPEDGINIVSVVLHSHLAGRRLSLKHIRQGKELPRIVQDNHFDFDYQQSYTLEKEVKVLPGDELITECIYSTQNRKKPTLGGYAIYQEMCLAFVMHYPRTPLAACFSITPVKEFFQTLGVTSIRGMTMDDVEKQFLSNESDLTSPSINQQQGPDYLKSTVKIDNTIVKEAGSAMRDYTEKSEDIYNNIYAQLIIEGPLEFHGRTVAEHMMAMPWNDSLFTKSFEKHLYHGIYTTFCRKRDGQLALPADSQIFPNYTALSETNDICVFNFTSSSFEVSHNHLINLVIIVIVSIVMS